MSISENVEECRYLDGIRTAHAYTDLKKNVEKTLQKVPCVGDQIVSHIRKTKTVSSNCLYLGCCLKIWESLIWVLSTVMISKNYIKFFRNAKKIDHAVLVHVLTEKGKGYLPAEKMPSKFHGTGPFDIATGQQKSSGDKDTYTDVFAKVMYRMGKEEPKLVAITAAMKDGTGLTPFAKKYPDRFFDCRNCRRACGYFCSRTCSSRAKTCICCIFFLFTERV